MQGKQAKIVSPTQERAILSATWPPPLSGTGSRHISIIDESRPRAKEMASLTWAMVTDAQGQVADVMHVPNRASKGKTGGRTIPLHPDLQAALVTLQTARADMATPSGRFSSPSAGVGCRRPPCACGSIGSIPR